MILTYYCAVSMILIAYLLGSIPNAVWIGKKYYGIDIREAATPAPPTCCACWAGGPPCRSSLSTC